MSLGDEKTERIPVIQFISNGVPISQNIAVEHGVANGTMGTIMGCQLKPTTTFEPVKIKNTIIYLASVLPSAVFVHIPSLKLKQNHYTAQTIPLFSVTQKIDMRLPNRSFRICITQIPYPMAFSVTT